MEKHASFKDTAIVACGTLNMELNHLRDSGLLDIRKILYTKPGRQYGSKATTILTMVFQQVIGRKSKYRVYVSADKNLPG